jgi:hypothetical protein
MQAPVQVLQRPRAAARGGQPLLLGFGSELRLQHVLVAQVACLGHNNSRTAVTKGARMRRYCSVP